MRIVILGAPGTGRNTQARNLAEKYGIAHISTSDLLSQAVKSDTRLGRQAKTAMDSGHLLADELMPDLILERLAEPDTATGFVLVGFPRTIEQALALEQSLAGMDKTLHMGVLMEMDQDALIQRLAGRWICGSCGHTFNIYTKPSKLDEQCDECGGDLHHRADDNEETIINRIRVFESQTLPVADYYKQKGHLRVVQGLGDLAVITRAMARVVDEIDPDHPMPVVLEELPESGLLSVEELEKRILETALQAKTQNGSVVGEEASAASEYGDLDSELVDTLSDAASGQTDSDKVLKSVSKKKPAGKTATSKKGGTAKKKAGAPGKKVTIEKAARKKSSPKKKVATSKKPAQKKKSVTKKPALAKKKTASKKKNPVARKVATKKKPVVKKKKAPVKKKPVTKKIPSKKKVPARKKPSKQKKATTKKAKTAKKKAVVKKKKPAVKKSIIKKKTPVKKKSIAKRGKSATRKGRKR